MKRRIQVLDTTLRDGEQSPGASLTVQQKLAIADALASMNIDAIEAGFPASSPSQFEAVKLIAESIKGPTIVGFARALRADIDAALMAINRAAKPRIHMFIATSDIHINAKFRKAKSLEARRNGIFTENLEDAKDRVMATAIDMVTYTKKYCDDIEFSAEDAGRSKPEYLARFITELINAGITIANIPDTTGYCQPNEYIQIFDYLQTNVPNIDRVILSAHCHDDLGLALANTLASIKASVSQVEVTVNGIGERAGNCALEEFAMNLRVRPEAFDHAFHNLDTTIIYPTSKLVEKYTGLSVPRNKAMVGANAFAHEAGIHQASILVDENTYEVVKPEDIGFAPSRIVLGRHSGRHGLKARLLDLGIDPISIQFDTIYEQFSKLADSKKEVTNDDLLALTASA